MHLVARDAAQAATLAASRRNERYLPGIELPAALDVGADLAVARDAALVLVATPVAALPAVADALAAAGVRAPIAWLSKGFVASRDAPAGVALAHQVVGPRWPAPVGVVSGPSFAGEVALGLPTALAAAATDPAFAREVAALLRGDTLRVYETDDLVGVEVGGAVKNVLAIAAGLADGLGCGHNARAALITRGLAEISRLAVALGGRRETLMGLAGLGDLVLTCTGDASRNRRVGLALARGSHARRGARGARPCRGRGRRRAGGARARRARGRRDADHRRGRERPRRRGGAARRGRGAAAARAATGTRRLTRHGREPRRCARSRALSRPGASARSRPAATPRTPRPRPRSTG